MNFKKCFFGLMAVVWFLICGEISVRVISKIKQISNIEWLKYTNTLQIKSTNVRLPYIHKPNSKGQLMGVTLEFNSLGHRNEDLKFPKGKNEKRIYFAGNSLLLAWGVPLKDSYTNILQNKLQGKAGSKTSVRYRSINAGIGGYTTTDQVELFKEQVDITKPDLAILQYFVGDAEDKSDNRNNIILKYSFLAVTISAFYQSVFFEATESLEQYYSKIYKDNSFGWENTKVSIEKLSALCKEKNIPLIALLVPDFHNLSSDAPYPSIYGKIQSAFSEAKIPVVDSLPALQRKFGSNPREAWIAHDDAHPDIEAHKIIGNELFGFIENLKIDGF